MSAKLVNDLVNDAIGTTRRIKSDVAHLKDLGRRAKIIGQVAARQAQAKIERGVERAADVIVDLERAFSSIPTPDGQRGRK